MKIRNAFTLALGLLAVAALPANAQESRWKLFGGVAYVSPLSDTSTVSGTLEASSEVGWEIGLEFKPWQRIGIELAYLDATHDVELNGAVIGEIGLNPIFLTANFDIISADAFRWYIGPTVAFVNWDDIDFSDPSSADASVDSEESFGISTGIDFNLSDSFAITGGARWISSSAETSDGSAEADVDPLFLRAGIAFRF